MTSARKTLRLVECSFEVSTWDNALETILNVTVLGKVDNPKHIFDSGYLLGILRPLRLRRYGKTKRCDIHCCIPSAFVVTKGSIFRWHAVHCGCKNIPPSAAPFRYCCSSSLFFMSTLLTCGQCHASGYQITIILYITVRHFTLYPYHQPANRKLRFCTLLHNSSSHKKEPPTLSAQVFFTTNLSIKIPNVCKSSFLDRLQLTNSVCRLTVHYLSTLPLSFSRINHSPPHSAKIIHLPYLLI